ncbi:MAG: hypothetical protein ACR2RL_03525 [Gammaproteobacteria bacterium]
MGTCTQGDDDPWAASLFIYLPLLCVALCLAYLGLPNARVLRWLTLPHAFTLIIALMWVTPYLLGATFGGEHMCTVREGSYYGVEMAAFQPYWAPIQLAALGVLGFVIWRYWSVD